MQTNTNRRKNGRINKNLRVFFGLNGTPYIGEIQNISNSGIAVFSNTVFQPGLQLDILIKAEGQEVYATGMVRWSNVAQKNADSTVHAMGISIDKGNKSYDSFIENNIDYRLKDKRVKSRFEKVLNVTYDCAEELMQAYTQNISLGGMFVQSRELLSIGSIIDVDIYLADVNDHIKIEGQVVYKVEMEEGENEYMNPGVGIEILRYYGNHKEKFQRYLNQWMFESE